MEPPYKFKEEEEKGRLTKRMRSEPLLKLSPRSIF
jgi:hypothetical protein